MALSSSESRRAGQGGGRGEGEGGGHPLRHPGEMRFHVAFGDRATQDFRWRANAPVLEADWLEDQLLDGVQLLTPDELRYLHLLGDRNDGFDVRWRAEHTSCGLSAAIAFP